MDCEHGERESTREAIKRNWETQSIGRDFLFLRLKRATCGDLINYAQHFPFSFFLSFFFVLFLYCNFCVTFLSPGYRHVHFYKFKDKASKDELDSLQL
jgi:hypothetical protein